MHISQVLVRLEDKIFTPGIEDHLCEVCAWSVRAEKFTLYVFLNALDDAVLMQEVHLVFGGVNVHVNILRGNL